MNKELQGKMYYTISEVAEMVGVEPYVLRFWEKEFPHLKPKKNRAGNRAYQSKDIKNAMQIKTLLYEQGYTIDGARAALRRDGKQAAADPVPERTRALIRNIRKEIEEVLKLFP